MNGLILLIILHSLIFLAQRAQYRRRDLRPRIDLLRRALHERNYGLLGMNPPQGGGEESLDTCMREQLASGRCSPEALEKLRELFHDVARRGLQSERFLSLFLTHAALCLGIALVVHLVLRQTFWLSLLPLNPFLLLALLAYLFLLCWGLSQVPWPRPLADDRWLHAFLHAWFDLPSEGPWSHGLNSLKNEEWVSGISQEELRQELLITIWFEELNAVETAVLRAEEFLGVGELLLASGLAALLWLPDLLLRISGLFET